MERCVVRRMNNEIEFDTEFMTDDEVQEMLDGVVLALGEQVKVEEMRTAVINPYKMQAVAYTYKLMRYLTKGTKAKVKYELHKPYTSMGVVTVVGSPITITNSKWFVKAVEFASNFEVYPKTDGTVQMNFTFHGLTKPIE